MSVCLNMWAYRYKKYYDNGKSTLGNFLKIPMDINQNTPLCFYQGKIWCIFPGQQSQCTQIQLKRMAYKELVQEGTFRYFWGTLAYTKKSRIRKTPNLSTDADSSINIFVYAGVKKGTDSIFLMLKKYIWNTSPFLGPHARADSVHKKCRLGPR